MKIDYEILKEVTDAFDQQEVQEDMSQSTQVLDRLTGFAADFYDSAKNLGKSIKDHGKAATDREIAKAVLTGIMKYNAQYPESKVPLSSRGGDYKYAQKIVDAVVEKKFLQTNLENLSEQVAQALPHFWKESKASIAKKTVGIQQSPQFTISKDEAKMMSDHLALKPEDLTKSTSLIRAAISEYNKGKDKAEKIGKDLQEKIIFTISSDVADLTRFSATNAQMSIVPNIKSILDQNIRKGRKGITIEKDILKLGMKGLKKHYSAQAEKPKQKGKNTIRK